MIEPLLVDTSPKADRLVNESNSPVWPVRNESEYAALIKYCNTFGIALLETSGNPGETRCGKGIVLGLGNEVRREAQLYGHLTQRRVIYSTDAGPDTISAAEVLVTTPRHLNKAVIERLYTVNRRRSAPGIICAADQGDLLEQVLIRSAASRPAFCIHTPQVDFYPGAPIAKRIIAGRTILGGIATPDTISDVLKAGAGLLTIVAHSDGIDADFGPLVLCPLTERHNNDLSTAPACLPSNICHRLNLTRTEAMATGRLFPPDHITAHILLLRICHGVFLYPSLVDPVWALSSRLATSATIGAIVTSWGQLLSSIRDAEPLVDDVVAGETIGRALARYNRLPQIIRSGQQLCLLGDPRTRCHTQAALSDSQTQTPSQIMKIGEPLSYAKEGSSGDPQPDYMGVSFLRAYLREQMKLESMRPAFVEAYSSVEQYEWDSWNGVPLENVEGASGRRMRECVMNAIFLSGSRLSKFWDRFTESVTTTKNDELCVTCGQLSVTNIARLRIPGADARRRKSCVRCGEVEDAPLTSPRLLIGQSGTVATVKCEISSQHRTIGVLVDPRYGPARSGLFWGSDSDSGGLPDLSLPYPLPSGLLYLSVVVIAGASVSMARTPLPHGSVIRRIRLHDTAKHV